VVPIVESVPLGEAYDLIIGVDGARVTNFIDFTGPPAQGKARAGAGADHQRLAAAAIVGALTWNVIPIPSVMDRLAGSAARLPFPTPNR
jgi:hypothetical protein